MEAFNPGDVVQLISGGPTMTIEEIGQYGYVKEQQALCKWFIGSELKSDTFRLTSLIIITDED